MINRTEAERVAASIHALRPDFPISQIMTLLGDLRSWSLLDATVALAYIATEQNLDGSWVSKSPYRVKEQGPWRSIGLAEAPARRYPKFMPEPKPEGVDAHAWAARVRTEIRPGRPRFDPASIHDHVGEEGDEHVGEEGDE